MRTSSLTMAKKPKPIIHYLSNVPKEIPENVWHKLCTGDIYNLTRKENLPADIVLSGKNGLGTPTIAPNFVLFNGHCPEDCGDFKLVRVGNKRILRFKTNFKAYNTVVCACLLAIKHHMPEVMLSPKGNYELWENAISYYEFVLDRKAPLIFSGQAQKIRISFNWIDGIPADDYDRTLQEVQLILSSYAKNVKIQMG